MQQVPITVWAGDRPAAELCRVLTAFPEAHIQSVWEGAAGVLPGAGLLVWYADAPPDLAPAFVEALQARVAGGLDLILLGGAVFSDFTKRAFELDPGPQEPGTWEMERVWVVNAAHPLLAGVPSHFDIPHQGAWRPKAVFGPAGELLCVSMFRGTTMTRTVYLLRHGAGRVLCVDVGDAGFPCYMAPPVQRLLHNAAALAADGTKQKDDET